MNEVEEKKLSQVNQLAKKKYEEDNAQQSKRREIKKKKVSQSFNDLHERRFD